MERIIIMIDGVHAAEKAETVRRLVVEQVEANGISGTNVYIEPSLQVMPFMLTDRVERSGTYGKQIRGSLRNGGKG